MKILSRILAKLTSSHDKEERNVIIPGDEDMNLVLKQIRQIHASSDEQKRHEKLESIIYHLGIRVDNLSKTVVAMQQLLVDQQTVFEEMLYALQESNIQFEMVSEDAIIEGSEYRSTDEDWLGYYGDRDDIKKSELN